MDCSKKIFEEESKEIYHPDNVFQALINLDSACFVYSQHDVGPPKIYNAGQVWHFHPYGVTLVYKSQYILEYEHDKKSREGKFASAYLYGQESKMSEVERIINEELVKTYDSTSGLIKPLLG